jgi:hypothetical protein
LKHIILLVMLGAVIAAMTAVSSLSVGAQEESTGQTGICAPWSKEWDLSKGWWYFTWYRWCYDPSTSDPSVEGSWYRELGDWEWGDQANLCPESGTCTVSPMGGGMSMRSTTG